MHHQFTDAKGVYQENSNGAIMHVQNPSPTKLVCKQSRQYLQYIGSAIFKAADQGTKALAWCHQGLTCDAVRLSLLQ